MGTHSRFEVLREFAWMLRCHLDALMNYIRMPIHNGTVEGLNNKAKVISHKAYGSGFQYPLCRFGA